MSEIIISFVVAVASCHCVFETRITTKRIVHNMVHTFVGSVFFNKFFTIIISELLMIISNDDWPNGSWTCWFLLNDTHCCRCCLFAIENRINIRARLSTKLWFFFCYCWNHIFPFCFFQDENVSLIFENNSSIIDEFLSILHLKFD